MMLSSGVLAAGHGRPSNRRYFAPILGLTALGALVATSLGDAGLQERAQARAGEANRIGNALSRLLDHVRDAETGARDYLLSGDEHELQAYDAAARSVAEEDRRIEGLAESDPAARAQLARVEALDSELLTKLGRAIDIRSAGDAEGASAVVRTDAVKATMDNVRGAIAAMRNDEARRAAAFEDAARAYGAQLQVGTLASLALVAALAAFAFLDSRRRFKQLWSAQDELRSVNQTWINRSRNARRTCLARSRSAGAPKRRCAAAKRRCSKVLRSASLNWRTMAGSSGSTGNCATCWVIPRVSCWSGRFRRSPIPTTPPSVAPRCAPCSAAASRITAWKSG